MCAIDGQKEDGFLYQVNILERRKNELGKDRISVERYKHT